MNTPGSPPTATPAPPFAPSPPAPCDEFVHRRHRCPRCLRCRGGSWRCRGAGTSSEAIGSWTAGGWNQETLGWFCWENLEEPMVFTIKLIGFSCKFSHHPILWKKQKKLGTYWKTKDDHRMMLVLHMYFTNNVSVVYKNMIFGWSDEDLTSNLFIPPRRYFLIHYSAGSVMVRRAWMGSLQCGTVHTNSKTRRRLARERKRCFSSSSEDGSRKR